MRLAAARDGDPGQFSELTEPYRHELQVHCYRILGSLHEAEDMVQETFLRAWRRLGTYEGRASFRAWLYKIATHACLDFLDQKRSRRLLPHTSLPASDPHAQIASPAAELAWLEPFPDEWLNDPSAVNPEARYTATESVSLSFLTALQALPPRQRAVLILRDVLDFSAGETAEVLEITVSSANSALHRARSTLTGRYHGRHPEETTASLTDERTQSLLDHFVKAWETRMWKAWSRCLRRMPSLPCRPRRPGIRGVRRSAPLSLPRSLRRMACLAVELLTAGVCFQRRQTHPRALRFISVPENMNIKPLASMCWRLKVKNWDNS
jgi:RNA polymerase sigma-70 factor (TIGR02960 family)